MTLDKRNMLRHFIATLAYRGTKSIKNAPGHYSDFYAGKGVRTPREILAHISGVLTYAYSFFEHTDTTHLKTESWEKELERFYDILGKIDRSLSGKMLTDVTAEQLLQGPLSDAMTHVGQLALLRRLADDPVPAENFICASIKIGQTGPEQPEPVAPDRV